MNKQLAVERIHVITPEIFGDVVRADDYDNLLAEYKASQDALKSVTELWNEQRQRIATLEAKTSMTMGVGDGNGTLFVHGDYDSIKAVQRIVLENEELRAKLATPVRLPKRWNVSGQVNPPRIVEVQFEQQNRTLDQCADAIRAAGFKVEGDA